jgi:MYXO-CTERM domain-containing protein
VRPILFVLACTSIASAGPVTYTLNFGSAPLSGSFTYDPALPVGGQFTAFSVQWNNPFFTFQMENIPFDVAIAANAPAASGTGCPSSPTSANFFAFLTGTPQCGITDPGTIQFDVHNTPFAGLNGLAILSICDTAGSAGPCGGSGAMIAQVVMPYALPVPQPSNFQYSFYNGDLTVAPGGATPEPSTLVLALAGVGMLALIRQRGRPYAVRGSFWVAKPTIAPKILPGSIISK